MNTVATQGQDDFATSGLACVSQPVHDWRDQWMREGLEIPLPSNSALPKVELAAVSCAAPQRGDCPNAA